ncbi:MAG: mechanosensitive ion channel family protein [Bacillota bacterium]
MQDIINLNSIPNKNFFYTIVAVLIVFILRWIIKKVIKYRVETISKRYRWYKINTYISSFITLIIIFQIWLDSISSLFTFLGIFSAGLAVALKDILVNFFAWIYIISRRPFSIGDRIEINGVKGDVIDIKIMDISLMEVGNWVKAEQSTGRIINIPNGKIFNSNVANFTKGFELIWNEISILITFESDWKKAKSILEEIAKRNSLELNKNLKENIIHSARKNYQKLTPIVYTKIKDSGVELTIRYLCKPRKRRSSSEKFWEDILEAFNNENNIDFAYNTYRYYNPELQNYIKGNKEEGEK